MIINGDFERTHESLHNLRINQHLSRRAEENEQFSGWVGLLHGQNSHWDPKI